jgi:hypothetical protein
MPQSRLYPNATPTDTGWNKVGEATAHLCVDDAFGAYDDGTTEINWTGTPLKYCICDLQNGPSFGYYAEKVQWELRARENATPGPSYLRINGSDYVGLTPANAAWTTYTSAWQLTNPDTGSGWTAAVINAMQLHLRSGNTGGLTTYITAANALLSYYPATGGFAYLIAQWLPPILAVASHGLLKREIMRILSRQKHLPIHDEDFARIQEALQRRPAYGFNGV